jgi:hypothetical protein
MNVGAVTAYRIKSCCGALVAIGTKRTIAALQQFGRYWTNNGQREAPGPEWIGSE